MENTIRTSNNPVSLAVSIAEAMEAMESSLSPERRVCCGKPNNIAADETELEPAKTNCRQAKVGA
eukprot:CAMPEP_0117524264 /NCGR_PEP_ID=MMETSP0784-20121206/35156_1 /TAXON_ID=39447 /ORGANISM="" /LENGTH=64 /DNA_ID=CAMNT_0005320407 /DNA_START=17 /DNA_END=209 /DNA_ORIENTATION=+